MPTYQLGRSVKSIPVEICSILIFIRNQPTYYNMLPLLLSILLKVFIYFSINNFFH